MTLVLHCLCYCLKMIIILRSIGCLWTWGWQEDFIWWWTRSCSMLGIGSDVNKIWKTVLRTNSFFPFTFNLWSWYLVKGLHTPQEKIVWWEISHIDVFEKISRSKVKGMKLMNNSLTFSEESFEFKKIKSNEHGHIHKASEYGKNPFLYLNFKSKSFVTNFILAYDPLIGIKN